MGRPVVGQNNYVHAFIYNLGQFDAAPAKVDFYWGDPSIGLTAAQMHLIGTEYVQIGRLGAVDVRCNTPWVPIVENGGHECLMVNSSNWLSDPIIFPFQPILDRHVGQHNVQLIAATAGQTVTTGLNLTNVFAEDIVMQVTANITTLAVGDALRATFLPHKTASQVLAGGIQASAAHRRNASASAMTSARPPTERAAGITTSPRSFDAPYLELKLTGAVRFFPPVIVPCGCGPGGPVPNSACCPPPAAPCPPDPCGPHKVPLLTTPLGLGEQRGALATIGVPKSAQPGEFIVCRLFGAAQTRDVGGLTIVIEVTGP
jgi:hypothetical protein